MACSVAGITSDANVLTNELRLFGQRYYYRFREPMPCEQLVSVLCDLKQAYTQYGGKRPFGVSILYMGWDAHHGYQLYHSDPSGKFFEICFVSEFRFIRFSNLFSQVITVVGKQLALETIHLRPFLF